MASKILFQIRRRPLLLVALLVVVALVEGRFGWHGQFGLWDGPI